MRMSNDTNSYSCYSIRRLNPFLGVLQVIATAESRAISSDGVDWEIEILAERPHDTWGAPSPVKRKLQFLRFGVWNRADGLSRVPANPLLDLTKMLNEANRVVELLRVESARIPFRLNDRFELWLLDNEDRMPHALLASTTEIRNISSFSETHWVCSNKEFQSNHTERLREMQSDPIDPLPNKHYLEMIVRQRTSQGLQRWFKRTVDECGEPLQSELEKESISRPGQLPADAFPLLLLNSSWDGSLPAAVVSDYHSWLSPYLLTLQNLPDNLRSTLEQKAAEQAVAVNACWRLYPKIINKKIIDAARVEARLRQSHGRLRGR